MITGHEVSHSFPHLQKLSLFRKITWYKINKLFQPVTVQAELFFSPNNIVPLRLLLIRNVMDGALTLLKTFLVTVPYCNNTDYEGHYQQLMYVIFSILTNYRMEVEQHTRTGRIDITIRTKSHIYVMELKFNGSAAKALDQIKANGYALRFTLDTLPVTLVGINFSMENKVTDLDWVIE